MYLIKLGRLVKQTAHCVIILGTMALVACSGVRTSPALTSEQAVATTNSVRAFAASVAADVTRRGPASWRPTLPTRPPSLWPRKAVSSSRTVTTRLVEYNSSWALSRTLS